MSRAQVAALTSAAGAALLVNLLPRFSISESYFLTFLPLFLIQICALVSWSVILYPKLFSPLRHLPQPKDSSFFNGQFWTVLKEPNGVPMMNWINSIPNEGLIRYTYLFNKERILVTNPKALGEVLVQKNYEFVKPEQLRNGIGRLLGTQRKNLMPAFAFRHVKELYPTFWSKSCEMVEAMTTIVRADGATLAKEKNTSPSAVINVAGWASRATLDIIGVAGMGQDFHAIQDPDTELNVTYRSIFKPDRQILILGLLSTIIPIRIISSLPFKRNNDVAAAAGTIRRVCRELIYRKQKLLDEGEKRTEVDILSVALESGGFTEEELVNQLMTFLAAGHETTSTALTWAVAGLCQHPEVQTRLRQEIQDNLSSFDDASTPMTHEDLDRLPYLHAVCNETLRVWTPVRLTRREAANDTSILGQFIPKGTQIILAPGAVNMSKALWGEDALEFNPDRWMGPGRANTGGADSNYSNLTFLHGPRSCIGQAFAKAEFACLLAALVKRFDMQLSPMDATIELEGGVTTRPKGGLNVQMTLIE